MSVFDFTYYKEFSSNNRQFMVEMVLGYNYALPTGVGFTERQELPDDFIINDEYTIDSALPSELPFGLQISSEMEITLDLTSINSGSFVGEFDITVLNWLDVKTYIIKEPSFTSDLVFAIGELFTVTKPNIWRILEDTNGDGTYDTRIFEGLQVMDQGNTFEYTFQNNIKTSEIMKLKILDVFRKSTDIISFSDIPHIWNTADEIGGFGGGWGAGSRDTVIDLEYFFYAFHIRRGISVYRKPSGNTIRWMPFNDIEGGLELVINKIMTSLLRLSESTTVFTINGKFLDAWTLYKQRFSTTPYATSEKGDEITDNDDIYIIVSEEDSSGELINGCFSGGSDFIGFESIWEFYKSFSEQFLVKTIYNFNDRSLTINKLYDNVIGSSIDVTIDDMITLEGKVEPYEKVTMVKTFIKSASGADISEIITSKIGTIADNKLEIDVNLHTNASISWDADTGPTSYNGVIGDYSSYDLALKNFNSSVLYIGCDMTGEVNNKYPLRLSDACTLDIGDGTTFSEDSTYDDEGYLEKLPGYPFVEPDGTWMELDYYKSISTSWWANRLNLSGFGYVLGKAGLDLLSNINQNLISFSTTSDIIKLHDLGNIGTFDMDELTNTTGIYTNKVIFTGIKENLISGEVEVQMFMRGK